MRVIDRLKVISRVFGQSTDIRVKTFSFTRRTEIPSPSTAGINPHFEKHGETRFAVIQYSLICYCLVEGILKVTSADKVEKLCP